jgi:hypothetical protein
VLLSIVENILEQGGGHAVLSSSRDRDWALPIGASVLGLRNMGLSGWNPSECAALEAELEAWQRMVRRQRKNPSRVALFRNGEISAGIFVALFSSFCFGVSVGPSGAASDDPCFSIRDSSRSASRP